MCCLILHATGREAETKRFLQQLDKIMGVQKSLLSLLFLLISISIPENPLVSFDMANDYSMMVIKTGSIRNFTKL